MNPELKGTLETIVSEGDSNKEFVQGFNFDEYRADKKTRFAVERSFEIIGEALNRLKKTDPTMLAQIEDYRSIISFRNILAHAYDHIEDKLVWGIIQGNLPKLLKNTKELLK